MDFVSDLHLQRDDAVWWRFANYLQHTPADAVFLLGDLFEVWVGDDVLGDAAHAFERQAVATLRAISQRKSLYLMHGNRDFLLGEMFCQTAGLHLLNDPCALHMPDDGTCVLLSHGDALCVDDTAYMQFRTQVRSREWQQAFLQQPLADRLQVARQLRQQSQARKDTLGVEGYADVDAGLARQWLQEHACSLLLHGHTHRPGLHQLAATGEQDLQRLVLGDWDLSARPARAQCLRYQRQSDGWHWQRMDLSVSAQGEPMKRTNAAVPAR